MKRVDINHPWMQEMISRRSGGDADYVAGVHAFLSDAKEPRQGTMAQSGYMDAYLMSDHISEIATDLWADAIEEEEKFVQYRSSVANCSPADWDNRGSSFPPEAIAARRRSVEVDTKLDRFIVENPDLREYYENLSKDELIRKLMLGKMQRSEYANGRNAEIKAGVEEHPEIKEKIEARIRNVPPQNRKRAFINAAKSEAMNQTVRRNGNGIRA
jgi:hypothetical protein